VNAFRKELETNLKDFRVESCTTHSVQMPAEFFPFTSQLSLALVSNDGKNFSTDIPVKADVTGKWFFPSAAEVAQRIGNAQRMASASPSRASAQKSSASSEQPAPYMKVDGTFVIQWPDANPPRPAATAARPPMPNETVTAASTPSPPPRPQPSAPAGAQPVMPVNRDVQIQFPSPP
jgi:hypothetical protein